MTLSTVADSAASATVAAQVVLVVLPPSSVTSNAYCVNVFGITMKLPAFPPSVLRKIAESISTCLTTTCAHLPEEVKSVSIKRVREIATRWVYRQRLSLVVVDDEQKSEPQLKDFRLRLAPHQLQGIDVAGFHLVLMRSKHLDFGFFVWLVVSSYRRLSATDAAVKQHA